jgi:GH35 family endo-1,4-beta-xylanase
MKHGIPNLLLALALSLPSVGFADWRTEADARIEQIRKGDFSVKITDGSGAPVTGARVQYRLKRHAFLFGTAIAYAPFSDQGADGKAYRNFILDNFSGLVCENEMKWYSTEAQRGHVDYSKADALLAFAEANGLAMRGHNLFWEKEKFAQPWLVQLNAADLRAAVEQRLRTTVSRYKGRVISWDVDNEMLDGSFYRDRLGFDTIAWMFKEASRIDPNAALFVNEYGILGNPEKTERLISLVQSLRAKGAPVGGVGIQSHDTDRLILKPGTSAAESDRPDWMLRSPLTPEAFLATLDRIHAATGLPVHLTEISAKDHDPVKRADALETLFRLGFSHEAVQAILIWGFGAKTHWMGPDAALMDADNTLNAAGSRISHLLREEWTTRGSIQSDAAGRTDFRGFYGVYSLDISLPGGRQITREARFSKSGDTESIVTD